MARGDRDTVHRRKRLESVCSIRMESAHGHEISSVFIYDLIEAYGGTGTFTPFTSTRHSAGHHPGDAWRTVAQRELLRRQELFHAVKPS